jgi:hypothetical protein
MIRSVCCAVLLLALLAGSAPAQPGASPPGSSPTNPAPASGVEVGSCYGYLGKDFFVILGYGWAGAHP